MIHTINNEYNNLNILFSRIKIVFFFYLLFFDCTINIYLCNILYKQTIVLFCFNLYSRPPMRADTHLLICLNISFRNDLLNSKI